MTEISWMMQEIITVRWAGLLRGEKEKILICIRKKKKIFSACGGAAIYRKKDHGKDRIF